jgi:hypothetical protein
MSPWAFLALLACGDQPGPATADCAAQTHEELRVPCFISQAERAAEAGDAVGADAACREVPAGRWGEECAFRAGEELARAGRVVEGVAFCGQAEAYARFCLTHVAWRLRPDPTWDPADPATAALPGQLVTAAAPGLAGMSDDKRDAGLRDLRAGLWYRLAYGQGSADPTAARAATGVDAWAARTAWTLEAVRLLAPWDQPLPADLTDRVQAAWDGTAAPPTGEPLPRERRVGRYSPGVPPRELGEVRAWPTFGGGVRLVSRDPTVDLRIALVEALYFRETSTAEDLAPFLEDTAPAVRWTAAWRMVGLLRPEPGQALPFADHSDPIVRALAKPPEGPPPGKPR